MNEHHIFSPATAQEAFFCIRQIYDDACPVDVNCAVRNVHEKHWIWTTRLALCNLKFSTWLSFPGTCYNWQICTSLIPFYFISGQQGLYKCWFCLVVQSHHSSRHCFVSHANQQHTPRKFHIKVSIKDFWFEEKVLRAKSGKLWYPSSKFEGKYTD